MTKDEALDLALEALEYRALGVTSGGKDLDDRAITAIKQALAAPVQEPTATVKDSLTTQPAAQPAPVQGYVTGLDVYLDPADMKPKRYPAAQPAPVQAPIKPDTLSLEQLLRAAVYWGATYAKGDYHDALEGKIYQWISLRSGATPPAAPVQEPVQLTIPEGMVLVPYEPSTEMQEQGSTASGYDLSQKRARHVYQSMIDMHVVREGKQARSAPVQEPVAWMGTDIEGNPNKFRLNPFNGGVELYKKPQSVKVWDAEGYDALMQELELWKAAAQRQWVGLTEREIELLDGMIEVQLDHAKRCDSIANRTMAEKQKGWDMERVALLKKLKENT